MSLISKETPLGFAPSVFGASTGRKVAHSFPLSPAGLLRLGCLSPIEASLPLPIPLNDESIWRQLRFCLLNDSGGTSVRSSSGLGSKHFVRGYQNLLPSQRIFLNTWLSKCQCIVSFAKASVEPLTKCFMGCLWLLKKTKFYNLSSAQ